MHPMNVSLEKEMWEEENFEKHLEGIGKMGKEDKIHQFTYYQWGAFFFLMQVGNLALKNKLSSCKHELKLNYWQILPKHFNPNYLVRRPILRNPDYYQKQATIKTDSSPKSCQY